MTAAEGAATARLRTRHPHAAVVAAALAPDNTAQIETRAEGDRVRTTVRRDDVAGLRATVQDYLRNADAADRTVRAALSVRARARARGDATTTTEQADDRTNTDSPINEDTQTTDNE
ncbi:hypothetical protein BRD18_04090 [Halobacteriales archaeon SW_7_71_33]|nr:MAG: hypothetical protein BRD18_04090 [Halobacteriales archaeon SW_7_71_33]